MRMLRHKCYQLWEGGPMTSLNVGRVEAKCLTCYGWICCCLGKREGPRISENKYYRTPHEDKTQ